MSFVRGVGFEPTTSLPGDSIKAFPRNDIITVLFPPTVPNINYYNTIFILTDSALS
jgi:hypothetical protein